MVDQPLIYVSDGFENMSGYTNENLELQVYIRQNHARCVWVLNGTKNDMLFWSFLYLVPITRPDGQFLYSGVQIDITSLISDSEPNLLI